MNKLLIRLRKEPVLLISAGAALLSMLAVPPSRAYLDYIDFRVLCLLFCLMAVVAGLQRCGLFALLARRLLAGRHRVRTLVLLLVLLPFFSSMLVTNDVALITFVPFAVLVLFTIGRERLLMGVVILQTVAANLGSMATPVGNPQNLFLYTQFHLTVGDFFAALLPLTLVSLAGLAGLCLLFPGEAIRVDFPGEAPPLPKRRTALHTALFLLCLLCVLRMVPYPVLTAAVLAALLLFDRPALKAVDYGLLLTFVCFFVFAGNIGAIPAVRAGLSALMERSALLTSLLASQVISNVPAAVLLSGFTQDWRGLLVGVDVGGLGTLIASLASLISFKLYAAAPGARPLKYLARFTLVNVGFLAVLLLCAALLV